MAQQLVELFVVADGKLKMTGHDTLLLVVTSSITSKFQNFSCQVFEDSSKVHCRPDSDQPRDDLETWMGNTDQGHQRQHAGRSYPS